MKDKKNLKVLQQGCCDVSNYQRMSTPSGKATALEAEQLAEEMLADVLDHAGGPRGAAVAIAATAMVRSYLRKAVAWMIGGEALDSADAMDRLFMKDCWMRLHNDRVQMKMYDFVNGES